MWCGPTTAFSESCSVNFGFFMGVALGVVIAGYCVMGGCLKCF